jgi:hypothetical protein
LDLQRSGFSPLAIQWLWDKGHASLAEVFARFNLELRKNACVSLLRISGFSAYAARRGAAGGDGPGVDDHAIDTLTSPRSTIAASWGVPLASALDRHAAHIPHFCGLGLR